MKNPALRQCLCVLPRESFCGTCYRRRELASKFDPFAHQRMFPLCHSGQTGHHSAGVPCDFSCVFGGSCFDRLLWTVRWATRDQDRAELMLLIQQVIYRRPVRRNVYSFEKMEML